MQIIKAFQEMAIAFYTITRYNLVQLKYQKEIILSMLNILELHDTYTSGHSQNVAKIATSIAENMGLDSNQVKETYWAALIHDIGKIIVPARILNKKGRLEEEEFERIKKHPVWGHQILKNSEQLSNITEYVLHHHERWDGKGYPHGLKKDEIPLISQIVAIADAWDAMRSERAYREPLDFYTALGEINRNKGTQFSPEIADVFLELMSERNEFYA